MDYLAKNINQASMATSTCIHLGGGVVTRCTETGFKNVDAGVRIVSWGPDSKTDVSVGLKVSLHDILKGQKGLKTADWSVVLSHTNPPTPHIYIQQLKHNICFPG